MSHPLTAKWWIRLPKIGQSRTNPPVKAAEKKKAVLFASMENRPHGVSQHNRGCSTSKLPPSECSLGAFTHLGLYKGPVLSNHQSALSGRRDWRQRSQTSHCDLKEPPHSTAADWRRQNAFWREGMGEYESNTQRKVGNMAALSLAQWERGPASELCRDRNSLPCWFLHPLV